MSLIGGSKKAVKPTGPSTLVAISKRNRAVKALLRWMKDMDKGRVRPIEAYAEEHGLTKRKMLNVLRNDEHLQKEIFEPALMEARMGLVKAISQAYEGVDDAALAAEDQHRWAEFLAKLLGGYYEKKKDAGGTLVIANLIPQVAPQYEHLNTRIIEHREVESLGDLGA